MQLVLQLLTLELVDLTVARNFSGPHATSGALLLAGVAETLPLFLAAYFMVLVECEHGLHDCSLGMAFSTITSQSNER